MLKIIKCTKARGAFLDTLVFGVLLFGDFFFFLTNWIRMDTERKQNWSHHDFPRGILLLLFQQYVPMSIQQFSCGPNTLVYLQIAVVSPVSYLFTSTLTCLRLSTYLYHSNFLSSLNFLILAANFLAQENSLLSCITFLYIKVTTFLQL